MSSPTKEELILSEELQQYLINANDRDFDGDSFVLFESHDGEERRRKVLEKLSRIVCDWASEVAAMRHISFDYPQSFCTYIGSQQYGMESRENDRVIPSMTSNAPVPHHGGVQLRLFGSSRLGVINSESDIDLLVISPSFLTLHDFFTTFCEKLMRRIGNPGDIETISAIPDAYTPVIKLTMDSIAVDMIFASLLYNQLPPHIDLIDLRWLRGLDDQTVRSLNGARVAEWICRLVPNLSTYSITLRVVKHWARRRGIYSSILGFLGGVNFAILVGYICQLYVNACPFTLLQRFFAVYVKWKWPTAVIMHKFEDMQFKDSGGRYLAVWNPKVNPKDASHLMPIITPAYPAMNSAYNVSYPQFRFIQEELRRAYAITQKFPSSPTAQLDSLFESSMQDFIRKYRRYVQIDVSAASAIDHRNWFGWVESRLRVLILSLEQPPLMMCHPIANCFHRHYADTTMEEVYRISSGNANNHENTGAANSPSPSAADVDAAGVRTPNKAPLNGLQSVTVHASSSSSSSSGPTTPRKTQQTIFVSSFFIGLSFQTDVLYMNITMTVGEFLSKINAWYLKKEDMDIRITVLKPEELPQFVFETHSKPSNSKSCTPKNKTLHSGSSTVIFSPSTLQDRVEITSSPVSSRSSSGGRANGGRGGLAGERGGKRRGDSLEAAHYDLLPHDKSSSQMPPAPPAPVYIQQQQPFDPSAPAPVPVLVPYTIVSPHSDLHVATMLPSNMHPSAIGNSLQNSSNTELQKAMPVVGLSSSEPASPHGVGCSCSECSINIV